MREAAAVRNSRKSHAIPVSGAGPSWCVWSARNGAGPKCLAGELETPAQSIRKLSLQPYEVVDSRDGQGVAVPPRRIESTGLVRLWCTSCRSCELAAVKSRTAGADTTSEDLKRTTH
jgi:hypothetical protein